MHTAIGQIRIRRSGVRRTSDEVRDRAPDVQPALEMVERPTITSPLVKNKGSTQVGLGYDLQAFAGLMSDVTMSTFRGCAYPGSLLSD